MADAAQLGHLVSSEIQLQQAQHLAIAVLFDDIYPLMLRHEIMHLTREWISAQAKIIGLQIKLFGELVAALFHCKISGAVSDDADLRCPIRNQFGFRNKRPRSFKLAIQTL